MTEDHIHSAFPDLSGLRWIQADVFTRTPLSGNGLAIFPGAGGLSTAMMQRLTQEMRQFEAIPVAVPSVRNPVMASTTRPVASSSGYDRAG